MTRQEAVECRKFFRRRRDPQIVDRRDRKIPRACSASRPRSRRNRFAGTVSDEFIRNYVDLTGALDAIVHGFFIGETMRGAAELRPLACASRARPRPRSASKVVAESRRRLGVVGRTCSPHATRIPTPAHGSLPRTSACSSSRVNSTPSFIRFRGVLVKSNPRARRPSLMREMMSDSHGFATAMLDLQTRMLRA